MTIHNAATILADPATAVVERAPLTRAFDIVSQAIERRQTVPILANARLMGDGAALFVTGTDLDVELTVAIPAAADPRFAMTLPAGKMRDLLKKATASDFVAFTDNGEAATVDFERVNYKLQSLPVTDFPDLRGPAPLKRDLVTVDPTYRCFNMAGDAFWNALDATMGAMSKEETRYYLNGIFVHVHHDGGLRMVATDGHRLYRQELEAPDGCEGMPGVILPRKTVALLHKLLKGKACPETVGIEVTETAARFTWGDAGFHVTLQTKLVDGTFPDYQRVIPTGNDKPATFDPDAMLEAVRAVTLISSERGRAVKMEFEDGKCQLAVNNPGEGSAAANVACGYDSDPMEIGFNAGYLVDAIATASPDSGSATITLADMGSPTLITGSRDGWLGVLMPLRV